jgi:FHS family L-fucose permease-like MFS transporter
VFIGSIMVMYLMQPSILAVSAAKAGSLVSLYWGGAMVGRFVGSEVLKRIDAGRVLAGCALGAGILAAVAAVTAGPAAAAAIIAVGLCNSIMFPTIFSLALEGLGDDKPTGSGILCMAIVGGAIIPPLAGSVADGFGLATALLIPVVCYGTIALYGLFTRNAGNVSERAVS